MNSDETPKIINIDFELEAPNIFEYEQEPEEPESPAPYCPHCGELEIAIDDSICHHCGGNL